MQTIEIKNVAKSFSNGVGRTKTFIRDLTFFVEKGSIVVLIGPNGSGKTTLIKMILSLLRTDKGTISVLGAATGTMDVRREIGYLPEVPRFPEYLNAEEFLQYVCQLNDMPRAQISSEISNVLERVELNKAATVPIRKYSKGMRKRLGIAQAIIGDPKVLILDEPLDGLDPCGAHIFSTIMKKTRAKGVTVLLTTHLLNEIEEYADKVAIIKEGTIIFEGMVNEIKDNSLSELYMRVVK
ncbi:MAG: ABC transporter ATP-binding protein [Candidatus Omnitrophica bacterium]|nr:ABC transporter ATP-binding protein [Candidatus Omnitrophota bacterium]